MSMKIMPELADLQQAPIGSRFVADSEITWIKQEKDVWACPSAYRDRSLSDVQLWRIWVLPATWEAAITEPELYIAEAAPTETDAENVISYLEGKLDGETLQVVRDAILPPAKKQEVLITISLPLVNPMGDPWEIANDWMQEVAGTTLDNISVFDREVSISVKLNEA